MAASNRLEVEIGASISELEAKLKKADSLVESYNSKISHAKSIIDRNNASTQKWQKEMDALNNKLYKGTISSDKYNKEIQPIRDDTARVAKETKEWTRELDRLQREQKQTENTTENLNNEIARTVRSTRQTTGANTQLTRSNKRVGKSSRNASAGAVEFGRALGDLPYGIQGVANNLQQMAFVMGAGAALQIGLTAVTAGMLAMEKSGYGLSDVIGLLTEDNYDLVKSQKAFAKAFAESRGGIQTEIIQLQELIKIARDETQTRERRNQAVQILQDKYPKYLENLSTENATSIKISNSIDKITSSLERKAKVQAAEQLVTKQAQKLFESQIEAQEDYLSRRNLILQGAELALGFEIDPDNLENLTKAQALAIRELVGDSIKDARDEQRDALNSSLDQYENYADKLRAIIRNTPNLFDIFDEGGGTGGGGNETDKKIEESIFKISELRKTSQEARSELDNLFGNTPSIGLESIFEAPEFGQMELPPINPDRYIESIKRAIQWSNILSEAVGSSFRAMAAQVSSSLETENTIIDSFVSSIINSLASLASALVANQILQLFIGKKKIATEQAKSSANAITIATNAAAALGPFGIAALPGLIASQLALVNGAFAGIQAFAHGGIVGGGSFNGDNVPALVNSGEMILNNGQQAALFRLLDGRMGMLNDGREGIVVDVRGELRGETIKLATDRYMKRRSRIN